MKKAISICLFLLIIFGAIFPQDIETTNIMENKNSGIILFPTAYTKQRGQYESKIEMEPFKIKSAIGITQRLMLGVSYGGEHVIGTTDIDWYPKVEFNIKYRLFDEKQSVPAFAVGFSSDGWGKYLDSAERYLIKSRGFFAVASKDITIIGGSNVNFGVNYSVEGEDESSGFDIFTSVRKNLNEELSIIGEYDFAINDSGENKLGEGKGYLNFGIRWNFAPELVIDFQLINVLQNFNTDIDNPISVSKKRDKISRNIAVTYRAFF
ncbi:MAG: hypothetical protein FXF47_02200 [Candidatus Mcinerneyibacterium aminivorans]|jgi:hypothetical protein|uniref:DUF481 domain-containing protein n=1 Tax=Candidatus Mcinerneyibacterium aminivorans TaxID=2703815 RepID=A0A5D0MHF2_9BACT|nr:MAG: hypothetical protein FXF47_02200 [Candidatus Mcinerneyibacterium aminivorans]